MLRGRGRIGGHAPVWGWSGRRDGGGRIGRSRGRFGRADEVAPNQSPAGATTKQLWAVPPWLGALACRGGLVRADGRSRGASGRRTAADGGSLAGTVPRRGG